MSPAQMLSNTGLHSVQQELKVFFLPLPYLSVFNVLSLAFLLEALWFLGLLLHLSSSPLPDSPFPYTLSSLGPFSSYPESSYSMYFFLECFFPTSNL